MKHGSYYMKRNNRWIPLGKDYGQALVQMGTLLGTASTLTRFADIGLAMIEDRKDELAEATVKLYRTNYANTAKVFGDMDINDITPPMIYQYVRRADNVMGNRDKAYMSSMFTWARNNGYLTVPDPTKGLQERKTEKPRSRYVTDDELARILEVASPKTGAVIRVVYLLGCRISDALGIEVKNITDDKLTYWNSKSKRMVDVEISDELRSAVDDAMRLWRRFGRVWLFESRAESGDLKKKDVTRYTYSGFRSNWLRALEKAKVDEWVTLHDIRRKAGSDSDSDERAGELLDHADIKVTKRHYRAKPRVIRPLK